MDKQNLKTIIKFDVGADGFLKMIFVLGIGAVIVLGIGVYFLTVVTKELQWLS
jgi:hypothetical protein